MTNSVRPHCMLGPLLLFLPASLQAAPEPYAPLDRPAYPLYAIIGGEAPETPENIERLAKNFQFAQAHLSPDAIKRAHAANPDFKVLKYINSTHTHGGEDVREAESKYRRALAMYRAGKLAGAIDAKTMAANIVDDKGKPVALKPSTVAGAFSSIEDGRPSTQHFVTWIRIDDELLRIEISDPGGGPAFSRGFDGSAAAPHTAGANVFVPCYLGASNETGAYPGGPGRSLRYTLDVLNPDGWRWKAEMALAHVNDGFDGVWLDIFSSTTFNVGDMNGRKLEPWNFEKGRPLTHDEHREGQERKAAFMQQVVHEKTGRWPFLVGNNIQTKRYHEGNGGERDFLVPTKVKPRPLDGMCVEDAIGGYRDGLKIRDEAYWKENMKMMMEAAQDGLALCPMIGNAGGQSRKLEPDTEWRDRFERFGYATYLMAVEKTRTMRFGIPACYETPSAGKRAVLVHEQYYYPIGDPAESRKPDDLEGYKVPGTHTYLRKFAGGVVAANPNEKETDTGVPLGGEYYNPQSKTKMDMIDLPPQTGRILLRSP